MELLIGLVGITGSIAVAYWQYLRAEGAKRELEETLESMPRRVAGQLIRLVGSGSQNSEAIASGLSRGVHRVRFEDVDGDGADELLVEYQAGAHGTGLKVFVWNDDRFEEVSELWTDTGAGFAFCDFDEDGRIEVETYESARLPFHVPYAARPRDRVVFRLERGSFVEVNREPQYTTEEVAELRREFA